jgi:hypothetical protein
MVRLLTVATVALALFPVAVALVNACSDSAPTTVQSIAAEKRFQTNYCYNQYRSQSDVVRCLARGI